MLCLKDRFVDFYSPSYFDELRTVLFAMENMPLYQ